VNAAVDALQALNAAANQILAVVAPDLSRVVSAHVSLDEDADTAYTDGVGIWLPPTFEGEDVAANTPLAIGLLDHELGHFLQPLEAIEQVAKDSGAPGWLVNIALDIHDEALMASLFPLLARTLHTVRELVGRKRMADYRRDALQAVGFAEAAGDLALAGRFGKPDEPFDVSCSGIPGYQSKTWSARAAEFLSDLDDFRVCAARDLPDAIRGLIQHFPELKQAPAPPLPLGAPRVRPKGRGGAAAAQEAQGLLGDYQPSAPQIMALLPVTKRNPPEPQASLIAPAIRARFPKGKGAIEVIAPGRADRHALARGEGIPYRMQVRGRDVPAPLVVLCLDKSGSMAGTKLATAFVAGQAIALAVKSAGGQVVCILFDDYGSISANLDDGLLFADRPSRLGGTDFGFLADAWRRFPEHWVVILSDGAGDVPFASPPDKERTSVVVIPDGDADQMALISNHVVELKDINALPYVMATLIPRSRIA
jgi:hypothetical protein